MIYYTGKHKAQVGLPTGPNRQQVLFLSRVFSYIF